MDKEQNCLTCLWHVVHMDEMEDGRFIHDGCSCSYHLLNPESQVTHSDGDYGDCPAWEPRSPE